MRNLFTLFAVFFVFSCGGGGGGGSAPSAPAPAQVTVNLSGSATTLDQGETYTLTWSSSNATSCTASGSWSGSKATSGSESFGTADNELGSYTFSIQCSGSSGSSASSSTTLELIEPLYNLTGKVQVAYNSFVDSDVPNTDYTSVANNTPETAQPLSLPAQLVGHASNATDEWDAYKVVVTENQFIALEIADYDSADPTKNDLDLFIVDMNLNIIADSESLKSYEFLTMPQGEYLIGIRAFAGASKYVLSIGTRFSQSYSSSVFSSEYDYVDDKLLIQKTEILELVQEAALKQSRLLDELGFDHTSNYSTYSYSEKDELLDPRKVFKKFSFLGDSSLMSRALTAKNPEAISHAEKRKVIALINANTPEYTILPNIGLSVNRFSSDTYYYRQWHHVANNLDDVLNSIGQNVKDVVVAVVDTGRPEKNSPAYRDINFVDDEMDFLNGFSYQGSIYEGGYDGDGIDSNAYDSTIVREGEFVSHGTHVASTIASKNNGIAINGMAVKVMPIRALSNVGTSPIEGIINAFKYAAGLSNSSGQLPSRPASIINASLGGASSEYCSLIQPVLETGIIFVAASGNDARGGQSYTMYPASCPGVISVGAYNPDFTRSAYSNFNSSLDISAPGGDWSVLGDSNGDGTPDGVYAWVNNDSLRSISGTSMASPQVAGAIALMKSIQPNLSYDDVSNILANGGMTNDLGLSGRDDQFGHGALDIAKAISSLSNFDPANANTFGSLNQSTYDFGTSSESITMKLVKYGTGDLKLISISADNPDGLSQTNSSDAEGFGEYTISLDRSSYENGTYHNAIYFTFDNNTYTRAYITYNVGPEPPLGSIEVAYMGLIDGSGDMVATKKIDLSSGLADFSFVDLKEGPYELVIVTDIDQDDAYCTTGEFCRFFPFDSSFGAFTLTEDTDIGALGLSIGSAVRAASLAQQKIEN